MAAMRSALVMLRRRSCASFGSLAAASMGGGRGLEILQMFRRTAPSLRPSAGNLRLQGLHRFSTGGMKCTDQKKPLLMKHEAENVWLRCQRSKDHVKNYLSTSCVDPYVKSYRHSRVLGAITGLSMLFYLVIVFRAVHLYDAGSGTNSTAIQVATCTEFPYFMLPGYRNMHLNAFGGDITPEVPPTTQR